MKPLVTVFPTDFLTDAILHMSSNDLKVFLYIKSKIPPNQKRFEEVIVPMEVLAQILGTPEPYGEDLELLSSSLLKSNVEFLSVKKTSLIMLYQYLTTIESNNKTFMVFKLNDDFFSYLLRTDGLKTSISVLDIIPLELKRSVRMYLLLVGLITKCGSDDKADALVCAILQLEKLFVFKMTEYGNSQTYKLAFLDPVLEHINRYTALNIESQVNGRYIYFHRR